MKRLFVVFLTIMSFAFTAFADETEIILVDELLQILNNNAIAIDWEKDAGNVLSPILGEGCNAEVSERESATDIRCEMFRWGELECNDLSIWIKENKREALGYGYRLSITAMDDLGNTAASSELFKNTMNYYKDNWTPEKLMIDGGRFKTPDKSATLMITYSTPNNDFPYIHVLVLGAPSK